MVYAVGPVRSDYCDIIFALSSGWEPVTDPKTAFAMALPLPLTRKDKRLGFSYGGNRPFETFWHALAGEIQRYSADHSAPVLGFGRDEYFRIKLACNEVIDRVPCLLGSILGDRWLEYRLKGPPSITIILRILR